MVVTVAFLHHNEYKIRLTSLLTSHSSFYDEPRGPSSGLAIQNSTAPPSPFELDPRQRSPCALPADLNRDEGSTIAGSSRMSTPYPVNSTPSNGAHDYDELMWNVAHYQQRCEKAEEDYKNLERDTRQNKSFLLATKGIPDAIRKELEKKNLDIANLKRRQRNQEHLKPYLTLQRMSTEFPCEEEFRTAFADMRSNFDSLLVIQGFRLLPANLVCDLPEASDLRDLLVKVFGEELESADQKLLQRFLRAPANAMVQALTGAAVCQWVFQSELRCMELTNTSLLQKYRECIEEICGEDVASKLNNAAHQKLFKSAHFKQIAIPRIAAKHTQRLLDALHPLIDDKRRSRTTSKMREYLEGIFYCGIQAKCLTWVGNEDYEWIWHPCHSAFQRSIMQTESSDTTRERTHVRLPLIPGFRVHRNNGGTGEVNLLKKLGKPLKHPGMLVKALVLV
ncbi:hypothetical protein CC80DRAFT_281528 [Byssothecium circinans]|uniref:Uncharacterized protein n=1 Tax=Byssothecium circinans TaxID=147558 RepID=A0A6A5TEB4_9PLEO|nr:hypothetical protein CC80DRAFT_281528 [Byssothecium circinans]